MTDVTVERPTLAVDPGVDPPADEAVETGQPDGQGMSLLDLAEHALQRAEHLLAEVEVTPYKSGKLLDRANALASFSRAASSLHSARLAEQTLGLQVGLLTMRANTNDGAGDRQDTGQQPGGGS